MNERYWDALAPVYLDQVHDSLACDREGVLRRRLDALASNHHGAVDFGCGVGRYLRALSPRFKIVHALDHSQRCIDRARREHADLRNIIYRKADLSKPLPQWKRQRVGVCMNVLIAPSHDLRARMLRTMHDALLPGAHLLLLVPALESALYVDTRLVEWNMRDGMSHARAVRAAMHDEGDAHGPAAAGIIECGGEPTKHYLREEAIVLLRGAGFDVEDVERVPYAWSEVFTHPPRWLRDPYPWHWLLMCRRIGKHA